MTPQTTQPESGHTPPPWHAEDDRVVFGSGFLVAECYGGSTMESIANAAFIVEAVNSYDANRALTRIDAHDHPIQPAH